MIRHVVMFRWKPDTAAEDVDSVVARLQTMPEPIPEIREYRFGADLGINDANWDFVVVADFETADDYLTYRDDPRHRALVAEAIGPHLDERCQRPNAPPASRARTPATATVAVVFVLRALTRRGAEGRQPAGLLKSALLAVCLRVAAAKC